MCTNDHSFGFITQYLIEQGFQEIKTYAQVNGVALPRFLLISQDNYHKIITFNSSIKIIKIVYNFWLIRKGPQCFSVYDQPRRTNNNIESFEVIRSNLWKMFGK